VPSCGRQRERFVADCENVAGCGRTAGVTVPRFMGSVWLCVECARVEALGWPDRTGLDIRTGDIVRIRHKGALQWGTVTSARGKRLRVWTPVGTCRRTAHSVSLV
jgi:hypothetical protein